MNTEHSAKRIDAAAGANPGRRAGDHLNVPRGYTGPVTLSDTGRSVWWTGRVAIGLRFDAPKRDPIWGRSALWTQELLLASRRRAA